MSIVSQLLPSRLWENGLCLTPGQGAHQSLSKEFVKEMLNREGGSLLWNLIYKLVFIYCKGFVILKAE